jgi:hypothetical protein
MNDETTIAWETLSELDDEFWNGWRELWREQTGTWRWGVIERRIVQREADGKCFQVYVQLQTGDNGPGYSRGDRIALHREVRAVKRVVTTWEAMPESGANPSDGERTPEQPYAVGRFELRRDDVTDALYWHGGGAHDEPVDIDAGEPLELLPTAWREGTVVEVMEPEL